MFKSLRRKFVATSVASVAVVIILMASTLNFINYYKMGQRVDDSLYEASKSSALVTIFSDGEEDMIVTKNTASKTPNNNGFSIAKIDENKNVIRSYRDDVLIKGKDDLQKLVTDAVNESSTSGYVGTYRYLKVNNDAGNLVLLLNTQRDLDSFHAFMRNSIIVSSIVILSVFILLVLISKKVIAPIQQSYQKQKQFITDASHELKTPLAIIRSNTDVLELENGDSKWTKNIQNQVDRVNDMDYDNMDINPRIKPILDMSQVETSALQAVTDYSGLLTGQTALNLQYSLLNPQVAQMLTNTDNINTLIGKVETLNGQMGELNVVNQEQAGLLREGQVLNTYIDGKRINNVLAPGMADAQLQYKARQDRINGGIA